MILIGFGHKARQGKNTAALAVLKEARERHARMYAFADALRAEVNHAVYRAGSIEKAIKHMRCPAWVICEQGKPRTLLQWWGTDYRRAQDPNYWVKRMVETLQREQPEVAVITDVRFPNEAQAVHNLGGYLVQVERTTQPDVAVPAHPSEQALQGYTGWDYYITAADVDHCHKQAADIYRRIVRNHGV